jgi:hypothetical protein
MQMTDKSDKLASQIERYKAAAKLLRAQRRSQKPVSLASPGQPSGAVLVVRLSSDAKPLSAFGGVGKVLGPSRIQIPEYRRSLKQKF